MHSQEYRERLFADIVKNKAFFYRFSHRLMSNSDSAEELLQDSILHAFEKIEQFEGGSIKAWVKRIIFTKFLNFCRRSARVQFCDIEDYDTEDTSTYVDPVIVEQALAKFDNFEIELIKLYVSGHDYVEIAKSLSIPVSTARVKIHRIKERIRLQK